MCAILCIANTLLAQESDVGNIAPTPITQSLITSFELKRLLNQPPRNTNPPRDANPLRGRRTFGRPIRDTAVQPASWQEEDAHPEVSTDGFIVRKLQVKPVPEIPAPVQRAQAQPESTPASTLRSPGPSRSAPAATQNAPAATQSAPAPTQNTSPDHDLDALEMMGPLPNAGLETYWNELDFLSELTEQTLGAEIDRRQASIRSLTGIDEAYRSSKLQTLQNAKEFSLQATQNVTKAADFQKRIANLDNDLAQLRLESKEPIDVELERIDPSLSIDAMQTNLRNVEAELEHNKSEVGKIDDQVEDRDKRMTVIPDERAKSREKLDLLHKEFLQKQATGTEDTIELLAVRAHELEFETKIQSLDQEASWHDVSQEKLPLEKTVHQRRIQHLELELKRWNTAITNRKKAELKKEIQLAQKKAFDTHPALREFSENTTKLAEIRTVLATKTGQIEAEKLVVDKQKTEVDNQKTELDKSIEEVGTEDSRGLLIQVHRNLIRPYEGMARFQELEDELRAARGRKLKLRNDRELFDDPNAYIRDKLEIVRDEEFAGTTLFSMALEAIEAHRQQLVALEGDNEEYIKVLGELLPKREDLLTEIAATRQLVDQHALWVRSADPLSVELLMKSQEGAKEFFDVGQWTALGFSVVEHVKTRPYECTLGAIGLMIAFVVGHRFKG